MWRPRKFRPLLFPLPRETAKQNGDIRPWPGRNEEAEEEERSAKGKATAGGALYYAKRVFTGWIYGRPLRLPRASPLLFHSRTPLSSLRASRPRKNCKIIPSSATETERLIGMQIRAMHMDAWGRIILGEFRELETRPPVIARANEFRWNSPSFFGDGRKVRRYWKSAPLQVGRKGDGNKLPLARVIYVMWRLAVLFQETTIPPRDCKVRISFRNSFGNMNVLIEILITDYFLFPFSFLLIDNRIFLSNLHHFNQYIVFLKGEKRIVWLLHVFHKRDLANLYYIS